MRVIPATGVLEEQEEIALVDGSIGTDPPPKAPTVDRLSAQASTTPLTPRVAQPTEEQGEARKGKDLPPALPHSTTITRYGRLTRLDTLFSRGPRETTL